MKVQNPDSTLSLFEKVLHLRKGQPSRVSRGVSAGQLSVVAEQMRERTFKSGSVILREGETPPAAYSLVRGRVRVTRQGQLLGEVGPGATVGFGSIIARDTVGIGAIAATDVVALELAGDTLGDIFDDHFPFLLEVIKESSRRHLNITRIVSQARAEPPARDSQPMSFDQMGLVERVLLLRMPGGPFERSSVDALSEIAQSARHRTFEPGAALWNEGDHARYAALVVKGTVACRSSKDGAPVHFRAVPGEAVGALEAVAGLPRWYDAIAETPLEVLEVDVDDLIDVFEDNIEMAMDYLAWVSGNALRQVESGLGASAELLDFFTGAQMSSRPTG